MRIGRAIIIPAIIALGATGSVTAGSVMPVVAAPAHSAHVQTVTASAIAGVRYHH